MIKGPPGCRGWNRAITQKSNKNSTAFYSFYSFFLILITSASLKEGGQSHLQISEAQSFLVTYLKSHGLTEVHLRTKSSVSLCLLTLFPQHITDEERPCILISGCIAASRSKNRNKNPKLVVYMFFGQWKGFPGSSKLSHVPCLS